jgi:transposase-like protein
MVGDDRTEELRILRDIARWTREAALPLVRGRVERLFDSDAKKRVYAALETGTAGVVAIEKATGVNHNEIGSWIKLWDTEGIVDNGVTPPAATFTLSELGIAPAPPKVDRPRKAGAK